MEIERAALTNFRNLAALELFPHPRVNVIYGENAQGKTNLIEALWLFTGARSFRGAKDPELVRLGESFARLELDFASAKRRQSAFIGLGAARGARLNGVSLPGPAKLAGSFYAVVFSPVHLSLIKDGPAGRRHFLDGAICQLRPRFLAALGQYHKILAQRNTLLKTISRHPSLRGTLDAWDEALAKQGAVLLRTRKSYLDLMAGEAAAAYRGISGGRESLSLSYVGTVPPPGDLPAFLCRLQEQREEDIRLGFTQAGPHRDDLEVLIDGVPARSFASQGQQRSAVLSLKLAECSLIERLAGETPVVLLDDVMSELDTGRRSFLLERMQGRQVFVTCCEPETLSAARGGLCFLLEKGKLISSQPLL